MKRVFKPLLALLLTVPAFLVMARIDAIPEWLYSDRGYDVLNPLFRMFGAVGVEGHEDVIVCVMLVASFVVSLIFVWVASALIRLHRTRQAARS